jgi:hypothetical protein
VQIKPQNRPVIHQLSTPSTININLTLTIYTSLIRPKTTNAAPAREHAANIHTHTHTQTPNFPQHFVTNYHRTPKNNSKNLRKQAVKETVTSHVSLLTNKLFESYVSRMVIISGGHHPRAFRGIQYIERITLIPVLEQADRLPPWCANCTVKTEHN